jgi:hypothetical protein
MSVLFLYGNLNRVMQGQEVCLELAEEMVQVVLKGLLEVLGILDPKVTKVRGNRSCTLLLYVRYKEKRNEKLYQINNNKNKNVI